MGRLRSGMETWAWGIAVAAASVLWSGWTEVRAEAEEKGTAITVEVAGGREAVELIQEADGSYRYMVEDRERGMQRMTAEQFAARLHARETGATLWSRLFNISTPTGMIWVGVGLMGQVMFTGRMVVQWFASERKKRSVVPPMFWWLSLIGATMLLAYFLWRRDVVGVLGQGLGWVIYLRNLHLIYMGKGVNVETVQGVEGVSS